VFVEFAPVHSTLAAGDNLMQNITNIPTLITVKASNSATVHKRLLWNILLFFTENTLEHPVILHSKLQSIQHSGKIKCYKSSSKSALNAKEGLNSTAY